MCVCPLLELLPGHILRLVIVHILQPGFQLRPVLLQLLREQAVQRIARLTGKDAKAAYALTQQITAESRQSDAWYPYFDQFAGLLRHKNSLVRNRAISILAANARWDTDGKFNALLDEFLSHVADEKPVTARQCVAALPELAAAKPELIPKIRSALEQANLSGYPDSMQPLVLKDIVAALRELP